mmetsp:Transcript_21848/g.56896  ORF Transcript_21848/g.56896 Transcript_21848/m.56896 type:complete len:224 (-) Transcript_21848:758-1429(-)
MRLLQEAGRLRVAVQREGEGGRKREGDVVRHEREGAVERGAAEAGGAREEELHEAEHHRLVHAVDGDDGSALQRQAAMHQDEAPQAAEGRDGEVGGACGLLPLAPRDPHAHISRLDHRHVVPPVADRRHHALRAAAPARAFHQPHHGRLLARCHAAKQHSGAGLRGLQQRVRVVGQGRRQRGAVHHKVDVAREAQRVRQPVEDGAQLLANLGFGAAADDSHLR